MQDRLWAWGGGARKGRQEQRRVVTVMERELGHEINRTIDGFDVGLREGREFKDFLVS